MNENQRIQDINNDLAHENDLNVERYLEEKSRNNIIIDLEAKIQSLDAENNRCHATIEELQDTLRHKGEQQSNCDVELSK